jgi:hypothetical protein
MDPNDEIKAMMDEDKEIWAKIEGCQGYEISTKGRVRSYWKSKSLGHKKINMEIVLDQPPRYSKIYLDNGYLRVALGKKKRYRLHRLLAIAFIPNPNNLECVDHMDRNTLNNSLSNLRWCSKRQNIHNSSIFKTNTTGSKGVYYRNDGRHLPWVADWRKNGQRKTKSFKTKEEAIDYREKMTKKHYDPIFYTSS